MEAFYPRLYITCIFGAEIYKCYGIYYQCYCHVLVIKSMITS